MKLDESPGLSALQCDGNDQWPQAWVSWSPCAGRDHLTFSLVDVSFDACSDQGELKHLIPTSHISTDFSRAA